MESESSRAYAGSPGYIKGRPILFANSKDVTKKDDSGNEEIYTSLNYNLNGFALRGADNMGKCYSVNTPLKKDDRSTLSSITGAVTKPLIESVKDLLYYDDPVFTFEDSLLYGCTVELNQAELASFCKNREWIHLMIY